MYHKSFMVAFQATSKHYLVSEKDPLYLYLYLYYLWLLFKRLRNIIWYHRRIGFIFTYIYTIYGCYSSDFETLSGIIEGSALSLLIFILFLDGLFSFLYDTIIIMNGCMDKLSHALVHADDTIIIAAALDKFK